MAQEPDLPELDDPEEFEQPPENLASVILVERSEDIAGICGRVDTAPTWAVVVHAPDGNRQLSTELGMRRLMRHSEEAGRVLAIATRSSSLASRARSLGVPVSRKPEHVRWDAAGKHVWRLGGLSWAAPNIGRFIQVLVIAGVAVGALALALTLAPSGNVVAYPPTETLTETVAITASEDTTEIDFDTLAVPAERITSVQRYTLAVPATGSVTVGLTPANVSVIISNDTGTDVVVAAGTALLAGPEFIPFEIAESVTVPAGGNISTSATAMRPGEEGNVDVGTVSGWFDERYRFLTVTNPEPASGGTSEPRPAVSPNDVITLNNLARTLENSDSVVEGLVEARPFDAVFLRTAETSVTTGEVRPAVGEPSDIVLMDVQVSITALAVVRATLDEVAVRVLGGDDESGEFIPGTVRAIETGARQVDAESGTVLTEIEIQGEFARGVTQGAVKDAVKGKSAEAAKQVLADRYGIEDAEVSITPGWAPWMPRFGFRTDVEFRARSAEEPLP